MLLGKLLLASPGVFLVAVLTTLLVAMPKDEPVSEPAPLELVYAEPGQSRALTCDPPYDACNLRFRVSISSPNPDLYPCYVCLNGLCVPHEAWCLPGDLNGDGVVDLADFAILQAAFGEVR